MLDLLDDPTVIEIMLNADHRLWVERLGRPMEPCGTMTEPEAMTLFGTIASSVGREINVRNPRLECELSLDGSRFEALIPPVSPAPVFALRKRASKVFSLDEYVASKILTPAHREVLRRAVGERKTILIVGGTGSGKTTLVNAVLLEISEQNPLDRAIILEDTIELQCPAQNMVALRTAANVDMTFLLKATLRLRPDRIIVGEVRDGAALALVKAWNTGHPGGVATVHANSALEGLVRLEMLIAEATTSGVTVPGLIAAAVDLIVFIQRENHGRRVREIVAVKGHDGSQYITEEI